jgi:transposase
VTLQLLWEEYAGRYGAAAYRRSAFCQSYRRWQKRLKRSMRQRHFAGEKLFVDYAGRTVPIYARSGEEAFRAQLFVSSLGASGCAYAEATRSESLPDWLASHVRALEFYGAAPTILVPDNPKVGVTRADRYEPELQRSYEELAAHYRAVVIPARPYRPKDKSRVELTVLLVCRWVLARLRHQRFFTLEELNAAIRPLLTELNERAFQRLPGSRRSILRRSTDQRCERCPRVRMCSPSGKSAPSRSITTSISTGITIACRTGSSAIACGRASRRGASKCSSGASVATHLRSYQRGAHTTIPHHMPKAHRAHAQVVPEAAHPVGSIDRHPHRRHRRASAAFEAPSGARLSSVSGALIPCPPIWRCALGGGK